MPWFGGGGDGLGAVFTSGRGGSLRLREPTVVRAGGYGSGMVLSVGVTGSKYPRFSMTSYILS